MQPTPPGQKTTTASTPQAINAKNMLEALAWAGMSEQEIAQTRGNANPEKRPWQRLCSAVMNNEFPEMGSTGPEAEAVKPAMAKALSFSLEKAPDFKECAYRYEYFMAFYNATLSDVEERHLHLPNVEQLKEATSQILRSEGDIRQTLKSDIQKLNELRTGNSASVDITLSKEEIVASLRKQAAIVGMGPDTSTAYHARKHYMELPASERDGLHPVEAYLNGLEKTIREGKVTNFKKGANSVNVSFSRNLPPGQGKLPKDGTPQHNKIFSALFVKKSGDTRALTMHSKSEPEGP